MHAASTQIVLAIIAAHPPFSPQLCKLVRLMHSGIMKYVGEAKARFGAEVNSLDPIQPKTSSL